MSDDLVKRLRADSGGWLTVLAADRIEELERGFWNLHRVCAKRGDRIEELEQTLTKAVEALREIANTEGLFGAAMRKTGVAAKIRDTLAEIEGEKG